MSLPRVVIDGRMVGPVPHGIARMVRFMAEGLAAMQKVTPLPYEPLFLRSPQTPDGAFGPWATETVEAPFLSPSEWFELPRALRHLRASLYHSPSFSSLPRASSTPHVITVHDLNHLHFGSWKEKLYYRVLLRSFMSRARQVLTVSEFSRREIAEWMGWESSRIEITWNAVDPRLGEEVPAREAHAALKKWGLEPRRYFLSLTSGKPHKNAARLVEAHAQYWKNESPEVRWPLLLTAPLSRPVQGIHSVPGLNAEEARLLQSAAGAVVFPSIYEGFGLPPVEGLAAGTPAVVSRIAPHEEGLAGVAPGEVLWVAPEDHHGWVGALTKASRGELAPVSAATRKHLLERFSPMQLARSVDRVYRRVLYL